MPKSSSSTASTPNKKPYDRSSSSSPDTPTTSPTKTPNRPKGKAWSAEELQAVFHYAIKNGALGSDKGWEGVVEGRNGNQIRMLWKRLVPFIDSMLEAKGKGISPRVE